MKPLTRLSLLIVCASLLPCLAIVWHAQARRLDEVAVIELRLALISDLKLKSSDAGNRWLASHGSHALAPLVSNVYHPDFQSQLNGRVGMPELLEALQGR